jgi:hypothetical protein
MLAPTVCLPRPRRMRGPLRWLWRLWTLPTNLVGHAGGLLASGALPTRFRGPAADAWLYPIRPGRGLDWVVAVTLGHAILHRPGLFEGSLGRLILAHELAHTRQHDWLGPLYLPLHIVAQSTSALLSLFSERHHSRVHDHNPLEQTFICLGASGYGRLARGESFASPDGVCDAVAMLAAFGLTG